MNFNNCFQFLNENPPKIGFDFLERPVEDVRPVFLPFLSASSAFSISFLRLSASFNCRFSSSAASFCLCFSASASSFSRICAYFTSLYTSKEVPIVASSLGNISICNWFRQASAISFRNEKPVASSTSFSLSKVTFVPLGIFSFPVR